MYMIYWQFIRIMLFFISIYRLIFKFYFAERFFY